MKIGFLHSLIRKEEKLLLEAFARHDAEIVMLDDRGDHGDRVVPMDEAALHIRTGHAVSFT